MHSPSGSLSSRLIACISLVLGHAVLQAAPAVSNFSASQRSGTKLVDLSYDLAAPGMLEPAGPEQHPRPRPRVWKYQAIGHVDDAKDGLWSTEASVVVGG